MIALCLALAPLTLSADWRYVVPPVGEALRRPPLVALALSSERPAELAVNVEFEGPWQRYGMLRFGDPDSYRIAVVLDQLGPSEAVLYVDAGRELAIDAEDRVGERGRHWETSLAVETRDAEANYLLVPRRVAFELGPTGAILGLATLGWLEGEVELAGRSVRALRRDGDANGFFHDPADQLWLDLDGDGQWSALDELFVVQPILSLAGARWAVRSDRLGTGLALEALEGSARVGLALPEPEGEGAPQRVALDLQALLVGRDGSAHLARSPGAQVELPAGEYRLGMAILSLADPTGESPWTFVFSESGRRGPARWHAFEAEGSLALDPLGAAHFEVEWPELPGGIRPGLGFNAVPRLYSGDGLLVNLAHRGRSAPPSFMGGMHAVLELVDEQGHTLSQATSGFA